jgi:hypothetical protein
MVDTCVVIEMKCECSTSWPAGSAWVWKMMYCLNSCEPDEYGHCYVDAGEWYEHMYELHCEGLLD